MCTVVVRLCVMALWLSGAMSALAADVSIQRGVEGVTLGDTVESLRSRFGLQEEELGLIQAMRLWGSPRVPSYLAAARDISLVSYRVSSNLPVNVSGLQVEAWRGRVHRLTVTYSQHLSQAVPWDEMNAGPRRKYGQPKTGGNFEKDGRNHAEWSDVRTRFILIRSTRQDSTLPQPMGLRYVAVYDDIAMAQQAEQALTDRAEQLEYWKKR